MAVIVVVSGSTFYGHKPREIPCKSVNVEDVALKLDRSWTGLEVVVCWENSATGKSVRLPLQDPAQPHKIPWEVLDDLGELRMGLVGMDGGSTVKPTIWLTYGKVVDGVDPDAGDDPQEPTPNYLAQMVQQATQANQAAQEAKEAAKNAADSLASAGPYAQAAKDAAEAAKASQDASATSARQANEAAQAAKDAAGSIGDSVDRAEGAATEAGTAKQAAETAQAAASNSAGTAQGAATTASKAAQTAKEAATQAGEYLATVKEDANNAESAALEAGKSQEAARDAAQEAANARDQANTAATSADTAKNAAEQAATTAGAAQSGAAQSAQAASQSASEAQKSKEAAEAAATAFPPLTEAVANKILAADESGKKLVFIDPPGGGGTDGEFEDVAELTTEASTTAVNVPLPFALAACRVSVTIPPEPSGAKTRNLYLGEKISTVDCLCRTQSYSSSTSSEIVYDFLVIRKHKRWLGLSLARSASFYQQVPLYTVSNGLCLADASSPLESLSVFTYGDALPEGTTIKVEGVRYGS